MLKVAFQGFQISTFSGKHAPRPPPPKIRELGSIDTVCYSIETPVKPIILGITTATLNKEINIYLGRDLCL